MTKYRTQSANVLNETDSFERQLEWMLFCNEQAAMLWSDPDGWKPGDPMYDHPMKRNYRYDTQGMDAVWNDMEHESGPLGNHVRPMFQVFDSDDTMDSRTEARCVDCDVWFGPNENVCFVCGVEVAPVPVIDNPAPRASAFWMDYANIFLQPNTHRRIGRIENVEETEEGIGVSGVLDSEVLIFDDFDIDFNQHRFVAEAVLPNGETMTVRQFVDREELVHHGREPIVDWLRQEMRTMLDEELARLMANDREYRSFQPSVPRRQGRSAMGIWMDEWLQAERYSATTVAEQADERVIECGEFDDTFTTESLFVQTEEPVPFVLPTNIDLSGVTPIEPPVVDVSNGELVRTLEQNQYYVRPPITERRRV